MLFYTWILYFTYFVNHYHSLWLFSNTFLVFDWYTGVLYINRFPVNSIIFTIVIMENRTVLLISLVLTICCGTYSTVTPTEPPTTTTVNTTQAAEVENQTISTVTPTNTSAEPELDERLAQWVNLLFTLTIYLLWHLRVICCEHIREERYRLYFDKWNCTVVLNK